MPEPNMGTANDARGSRIAAFVIDFIPLMIVTGIIWFVFLILRGIFNFGATAAFGGGESAGASTGLMAGTAILGWLIGFLMWAIIGLVLFAYFTWFQMSSGQTLGMKVMDVIVVDGDGGDCTQSQAMKRTAILLLPFPLMAASSVFIPLLGPPIAFGMMVMWLAVEAALFLLDDENSQRLGDRWAGTVVVETR
jgi:uncharacterized RDD family membrane protein YckC